LILSILSAFAFAVAVILSILSVFAVAVAVILSIRRYPVHPVCLCRGR